VEAEFFICFDIITVFWDHGSSLASGGLSGSLNKYFFCCFVTKLFEKSSIMAKKSSGFDTSFLDLLGGPSAKSMQPQTAPIELVTQFLKCVEDEEYVQAYELCMQIRAIEPSNPMMKSYEKTLKLKIEQGELSYAE
jgi:hypothetical protein